MAKMKKMVEYWKAQAGIPEEMRDYVDLTDVTDERQQRRTSSVSGFLAVTQPSPQVSNDGAPESVAE